MKTTYANQKSITCSIEKVEKGGKRPYTIITNDLLMDTCKKLNKVSALKVWLYFQSNQDGYTSEWSPQHCSEVMGLSVDSARDGFKELEKKGYITHELGNEYTFHSRARNLFSLDGKKKKYLMGDKVVEYTYHEIKTMFGEEADEIWEQGE